MSLSKDELIGLYEQLDNVRREEVSKFISLLVEAKDRFEEIEATIEVLNMPNFPDNFREAMNDYRSGGGVNWREV